MSVLARLEEEVKDGKRQFTCRVHFGYTDGISQTTIRGGPERYAPDGQQPCEPWLFVLRATPRGATRCG